MPIHLTIWKGIDDAPGLEHCVKDRCVGHDCNKKLLDGLRRYIMRGNYCSDCIFKAHFLYKEKGGEFKKHFRRMLEGDTYG